MDIACLSSTATSVDTFNGTCLVSEFHIFPLMLVFTARIIFLAIKISRYHTANTALYPTKTNKEHIT